MICSMLLQTSIDKLEREMIMKIGESHDQFITKAHVTLRHVIGSLMQSSTEYIEDVVSVLRKEVVKIKNNIRMSNVPESNKNEINPVTRNYLRLKPISELKENQSYAENQNALPEKDCLGNMKKRKTNEESVNHKFSKSESSVISSTIVKLEKDKGPVISSEFSYSFPVNLNADLPIASNIEPHKGMNVQTCQKCSHNFTSASLLHNHFCIANETGNKNMDSLSANNVVDKEDSATQTLENRAKNGEQVRKRFPGVNVKSISSNIASNQEKNKYKCKMCTRTFKKEGNLNQHVFVHSKKSYKCDRCIYVGKSKLSLNAHIADFDHSKLTFGCDMCEYRFVNLSALQLHRKNIHIDRTYECNLCKNVFETESKYWKHYCPSSTASNDHHPI